MINFDSVLLKSTSHCRNENHFLFIWIKRREPIQFQTNAFDELRLLDKKSANKILNNLTLASIQPWFHHREKKEQAGDELVQTQPELWFEVWMWKVEVCSWILKLQFDVDVWRFSLMLRFSVVVWSWIWNWSLQMKCEAENWVMKLKLKSMSE